MTPDGLKCRLCGSIVTDSWQAFEAHVATHAASRGVTGDAGKRVVREHWRTKQDGTLTLVDQRPDNAFDDGYRAGRRYGRRQLTGRRVVWLAVGMAVEFVLTVAVMTWALRDQGNNA